MDGTGYTYRSTVSYCRAWQDSGQYATSGHASALFLVDVDGRLYLRYSRSYNESVLVTHDLRVEAAIQQLLSEQTGQKPAPLPAPCAPAAC